MTMSDGAVQRGEAAEGAIARFIERRQTYLNNEAENERQRMWAESEAKYIFGKRSENRSEWASYHRRMITLFEDLAEQHRSALGKLVDDAALDVCCEDLARDRKGVFCLKDDAYAHLNPHGARSYKSIKRLSARCASRRPLVFRVMLYPLTPPGWRSHPQPSLARHIGGSAARFLSPPSAAGPHLSSKGHEDGF